ncbi:TonB family protein [Ferruginibacter paludis]|uniref:energy transducer TonB n=1 Tax=Ferruginibacter paludis TaxID=1310417 RepID=UPI0025B3F15F|nr:energy transducer TonB [Ferruginibacter paludis]MDN3654466.1 TonB family protein [Ferruginibacter paludis]
MTKRYNITACIITAGIFCACNMKSNNNGDGNTITGGTDSSMMSKTDTNMALPVKPGADTITVGPMTAEKTDSMVKTGMAKPDPAKKGKKGKVSIVTIETKNNGSMEADKEGFYANTEVLPAFPGGQKALESFFEKNIEYPADATDNGVEGTVDLNFAVDEKGKVYAPKVTSDAIGYGIEKEALRVFAKMPTWTPGKIKGKNVKTKYTLPIKFQLY